MRGHSVRGSKGDAQAWRAPRLTTGGRPVPRYGWAAFRRAHLFDYNPLATLFWLALAAAGAAALVASLLQTARLPAVELWQVLGWTLIVMLAAAFPVEIPNSRHSVVAGDALVFLLLALFGAAPAALAAMLEGVMSALPQLEAPEQPHRHPGQRPALAMYASGSLCEFAEPALVAAGMPAGAAQLGAGPGRAVLLPRQHHAADAGAQPEGRPLAAPGRLVRQHRQLRRVCAWWRPPSPGCCRSRRSSSARQWRWWRSASVPWRW